MSLISERQIRRVLFAQPEQFTWDEEDAKNLEFFIRSPTGAKLSSHLDSVLQAMLLDASSQEVDKIALHRLAAAKGFGLALGAIRLSMPPPSISEEVEPENVTPFDFAKSQPVIY